MSSSTAYSGNVTAGEHLGSYSQVESEQLEGVTENSLLRSPAVIGLLLMIVIIVNVLWTIWCTKKYEDAGNILETRRNITALWRDYTPCGILAVFSGRRERGWTRQEAREALRLKREANRRAEAAALALAFAKKPEPKPVFQHQTQSPGKTLKHRPQSSLHPIKKTNNIAYKGIHKAKKTTNLRKNVGFMINDYLKNQVVRGGLQMPNRSSTFEESLGNTRYIRPKFRKVNVTYKRPQPQLPAYTFEDNNVKIVISDVYDRYDIPNSELSPGTTSHRYEDLGEVDFRGGVAGPSNPVDLLDDSYEPIGPGPFPHTEELEMCIYGKV